MICLAPKTGHIPETSGQKPPKNQREAALATCHCRRDRSHKRIATAQDSQPTSKKKLLAWPPLQSLAVNKTFLMQIWGGDQFSGCWRFQKPYYRLLCGFLADVPLYRNFLQKGFRCNATLREENYDFDIPGPKNRNEGTFAKTALLQDRPSASPRNFTGRNHLGLLHTCFLPASNPYL